MSKLCIVTFNLEYFVDRFCQKPIQENAFFNVPSDVQAQYLYSLFAAGKRQEKEGYSHRLLGLGIFETRYAFFPA
ncbi:hypothetical protein [Methanosarcina acetivorans]|nr:hypothetical protein [Methanosarcina acetivorans]